MIHNKLVISKIMKLVSLYLQCPNCYTLVQTIGHVSTLRAVNCVKNSNESNTKITITQGVWVINCFNSNKISKKQRIRALFYML